MDHNMALIRLIYVSTGRGDASAAELDAILESAARRNGQQGITGMLLYADGSFMQVLEGEEAAVDETFGRVERDSRHTGIFVIDRQPITERSFGRWTMGFKRVGAGQAAVPPAYAPFFEHGFDATRIGARPGLALDILTGFAGGR
jgi:hypothetical protein